MTLSEFIKLKSDDRVQALLNATRLINSADGDFFFKQLHCLGDVLIESTSIVDDRTFMLIYGHDMDQLRILLKEHVQEPYIDLVVQEMVSYINQYNKTS